MKAILFRALIGMLAPIPFACTYAADESGGLGQVETTVTWMTVRQPEVNFLVTNRSGRRLPFSISVIGPAGAPLNGCTKKKVENRDPGRDQWTLSASRETNGIVFGVLPPGGWTHRAFYPAGVAFDPPCDIHYSIMFDEDERKVVGTVHIDEIQEMSSLPKIGRPSVTTAVVVEKDAYPDHVLVRVLVTNHGKEFSRIWVSDRVLACPKGERADWSTQWPVAQGADIGPAYIAPGKWIAFVSSVRLNSKLAAGKCSGYLELSYSDGSEWKAMKKVEFLLKATGDFSFSPIAE